MMQVSDQMTTTLKQGGMKHVGLLNCIEFGRLFHLWMVLQTYLRS